jgi:hypothetical protein
MVALSAVHAYAQVSGGPSAVIVDVGSQTSSRPAGGVITAVYLTACVRDLLAGQDVLFLTEAITSYQTVAQHLRVNTPPNEWWFLSSATAPTCSAGRPRCTGWRAGTGRRRSPSSTTTGAAPTVSGPGQLPGVLAEALPAVRGGRSAAVAAHLAPAQRGPAWPRGRPGRGVPPSRGPLSPAAAAAAAPSRSRPAARPADRPWRTRSADAVRWP